MKKLLFLFTFLFAFGSIIESQAQGVRREFKKLWASEDNYEVVVVDIGTDGTKLIKVWAYDKKVEIAKIEAKKNAVAACLFKGAPGSREKSFKPIITDVKIAEANAAFFDAFFATGGDYIKYINVTNDATGSDVVKMDKGYKVGIVVSVAYDALRKEMESRGIIKKLAETLGEGKKPTIMVVPADNFCVRNNYTLTFNNQGATETLPNYKAALQNDADLLLVIGKMNTLMADRGFPAKNLESELKSIESENAESNMLTGKSSGSDVAESPIDMLKRTAKSDIIIQLNYTINKQGPKRSVTFNLQGIDAYTGKQVAGAQGTGSPSFTAETPLLLEEAVLAHLDNFNAQLQAYFEDIMLNGREIKVNIKRWANADYDLEEEFEVDGDELELKEIIENWISDNTIRGQYNLSDATENFMKFEQVRIPVFVKKGENLKALDANAWVGDLRKYLKKAPLEVEAKLYMRGLGEAWLIIGEN